MSFIPAVSCDVFDPVFPDEHPAPFEAGEFLGFMEMYPRIRVVSEEYRRFEPPEAGMEAFGKVGSPEETEPRTDYILTRRSYEKE